VQAAGCGRPIPTPASSPSGAPRNAMNSRGTSASIITAEELQRDQRPLLDLLQRRLPNISVSPTITCPEVHLRGRNTLFTRSDPAIYVDGFRASNTCILVELSSVDLDRVEVYPSGISGRPGYRTDANGLILIFVRKGEQ
jgi:hypothetical protein